MILECQPHRLHCALFPGTIPPWLLGDWPWLTVLASSHALWPEQVCLDQGGPEGTTESGHIRTLPPSRSPKSPGALPGLGHTRLSLDLLFFLRFYLFMRDTLRERERQRHRQRETQASCGDPEAGLDPGTLGSRPGPKVDAQPLSQPGIPRPSLY